MAKTRTRCVLALKNYSKNSGGYFNKNLTLVDGHLLFNKKKILFFLVLITMDDLVFPKANKIDTQRTISIEKSF